MTAKEAAKRRVAIAQDVIDQIHAKKYRPTHMVYVDGPFDEFDTTASKAVTAKCDVCAIGGMFLSRFNLYNKENDYVGDSDTMKDRLEEAGFTSEQLRLIERCFEGWGSIEDEHPWLAELDNPEDRLIAIMQNIVDHKGTFKPKVAYEVK
jgi:hypothetical protein